MKGPSSCKSPPPPHTEGFGLASGLAEGETGAKSACEVSSQLADVTTGLPERSGVHGSCLTPLGNRWGRRVSGRSRNARAMIRGSCLGRFLFASPTALMGMARWHVSLFLGHSPLSMPHSLPTSLELHGFVVSISLFLMQVLDCRHDRGWPEVRRSQERRWPRVRR